MNKDGQIWISAVIYILIVTVAVVIVLKAGIPMLDSMKDRSVVAKTENSLIALDKHIQDVASEGVGSQRIVPLRFDGGDLVVDDGKLQWIYETDDKLIEQRTDIAIGNVRMMSGGAVSAFQNGGYIILQNEKIRVNISAVGSSSNWTSINTSELVNYIEYLEDSKKTNGTFSFSIDGAADIGTGYTLLEESGSAMASAAVVAHINATTVNYDLVLRLDSYSDYIAASIESFGSN